MKNNKNNNKNNCSKKIRNEAVDIVEKHADKNDFENLTVDEASKNIEKFSNIYSINVKEAASVYEVKIKKQFLNQNEFTRDRSSTQLISEFNRKNQTGNIVGTICSLYQSPTDENQTEAIVRDISGSFTLVFNSCIRDLNIEKGKTYHITDLVGEFQDDNLILKTSETTDVFHLENSSKLTPDHIYKVEGRITQVIPMSGLIRRCDKNGCDKILDEESVCANHGVRHGEWDLRIGIFVDDGKEPKLINIGQELTESLLDISIDQAAENGRVETLAAVTDALIGHYGIFKVNDLIGEQENTYAESFQLSPPTDLSEINKEMKRANNIETYLSE